MASTMTIQEGIRQTFKAASSWSPTATSATDVSTITGAAGRIVRITRIKVSGIATALTVFPASIIRRTTANSGGTSAAVGAVCTDSGNNNLAKASVLTYTANPTVGSTTNGGTLETERLHLTTSAGVTEVTYVFDFTIPGTQPPTLRSASDVLALNLGSASITGIALSISYEWTEEEG